MLTAHLGTVSAYPVSCQILQYLRTVQHLQTVTVNEQNTGALAFYLKQGFTVSRRSPLDEQGRPFPILYLTWR